MPNEMNLREYFERSDGPTANSPVGVLMVRVLEKNPGMSFDEARQEAHTLLLRAASKRVYRIPPVLTEKEQEARRQAVRARFPRRLAECRETPVSRVTGPRKSSGMGFASTGQGAGR